MDTACVARMSLKPTRASVPDRCAARRISSLAGWFSSGDSGRVEWPVLGVCPAQIPPADTGDHRPFQIASTDAATPARQSDVLADPESQQRAASLGAQPGVSSLTRWRGQNTPLSAMRQMIAGQETDCRCAGRWGPPFVRMLTAHSSSTDASVLPDLQDRQRSMISPSRTSRSGASSRTLAGSSDATCSPQLDEGDLATVWAGPPQAQCRSALSVTNVRSLCRWLTAQRLGANTAGEPSTALFGQTLRVTAASWSWIRSGAAHGVLQ